MSMNSGAHQPARPHGSGEPGSEHRSQASSRTTRSMPRAFALCAHRCGHLGCALQVAGPWWQALRPPGLASAGASGLTCSSLFLGASSCCSHFLPRGAEEELYPGPGHPPATPSPLGLTSAGWPRRQHSAPGSAAHGGRPRAAPAPAAPPPASGAPAPPAASPPACGSPPPSAGNALSPLRPGPPGARTGLQ